MPTDYLLDANYDLQIKSGDFVVGESSLQHQDLLIKLKKGELRQYPKTGVGIDDYLLNDNAGDAYKEIQKQFEADGMTIRKIQIFEGGKTVVQAIYP